MKYLKKVTAKPIQPKNSLGFIDHPVYVTALQATFAYNCGTIHIDDVRVYGTIQGHQVT